MNLAFLFAEYTESEGEDFVSLVLLFLNTINFFISYVIKYFQNYYFLSTLNRELEKTTLILLHQKSTGLLTWMTATILKRMKLLCILLQ